MNKMYTIYNHGGRKQRVSRRKAILHASKSSHLKRIPSLFDAPYGEKAPAVELAKKIQPVRLRERVNRGYAAPTLEVRFRRHLLAVGLSEIRHRHLSTPAGWPEDLEIWVEDRERHLWLIRGEGYHKYSARFGTWGVRAAYLVGHDEQQLFAVRVPYTVTTVYSALEWLKPRAIREAEDRDLPVKRQGDFFFRPIKGLEEHDMRALRFTNHSAHLRKDGGLTIVHNEHRRLILSGKYKWRAYQSTQLSRGGRRGAD